MFRNFIERTRAFVLGLPIRCDTHTLAQERAHPIAHNPSRTHHPSCASGSAVTQSDKLAVIVENRRHPHLAYVVRRKTAHPKYARVARGCVALSRRRCLRPPARMVTLRPVLSAAARQRAAGAQRYAFPRQRLGAQGRSFALSFALHHLSACLAPPIAVPRPPYRLGLKRAYCAVGRSHACTAVGLHRWAREQWRLSQVFTSASNAEWARHELDGGDDVEIEPLHDVAEVGDRFQIMVRRGAPPLGSP